MSACFYFSVVKQVNPTQIIVSSKQDERLIKTLKTYGKLGKLLTSDTIGVVMQQSDYIIMSVSL